MTRIARLTRTAAIEIAASRKNICLDLIDCELRVASICRLTEMLEILDEISNILGINHGNSLAEKYKSIGNEGTHGLEG